MAENKSLARITDKGIQAYLQGLENNLSAYNPNANMGQFIRSAMLMISEKKELRDCLKTDSGKKSLYHALKYAASTGLSLNPQEGKAALIAYGGSVNYQVMKNGLIDLAMQSGKVEFITSDTVRENDDFTIQKTMDGDKYSYAPKRKDRGEIDGFFAAVKLTDGSCHVKYMTKKEVEEHRNKYSAMFRAKPDASPWKKSFEGMGLKTVLKALFRNLAISPEIDRAVGTDDQEEARGMRNVTESEFENEGTQEIVDAIEETEPEPPKEAPKKQSDLF